ncbi:MAG: hypothetical protein ABIK42_00050 [candidate division WOR-3 bacterium]
MFYGFREMFSKEANGEIKSFVAIKEKTNLPERLKTINSTSPAHPLPHKRFMPYGIHPNSALGRNSFIPNAMSEVLDLWQTINYNYLI